MRRLLLGAAAVGGVLFSPPLQAQEQLWHFGAHAGISTATFTPEPLSGFGGGVIGAYGLTDAVNLRVNADVSVFELPEPATSALLWGGGAGIEYLVDVLRWVPYAGVVAGPTLTSVQHGADVWQLGIDIPFGLGYRLTPHVTLLGEGRYRLMFFGDETSPSDQLTVGLRAEVVVGPG